jgi:hypothetical protein
MTTKIALIASVMLLGLSGAVVAGSARVPLHGSAVPASRQSADPFKSFDSARLTSARPFPLSWRTEVELLRLLAVQ